MSTTPLDLDAITARTKELPPGPWEYMDDEMLNGQKAHRVAVPHLNHDVASILISIGSRPVAEFLVAARHDVPALVAEVRRLRGEIEEASREPH